MTNTTERLVHGGDAALCQTTLTTCFTTGPAVCYWHCPLSMREAMSRSVHGTRGSTGYETTPPVRLETAVAYLPNHMSKLHEIFRACYRRPWAARSSSDDKDGRPWTWRSNDATALAGYAVRDSCLSEARGNYVPEPPYLRETKTYHSQPLESTRHAGNYLVPLSVRPIFIYFLLLQKLICQIT